MSSKFAYGDAGFLYIPSLNFTVPLYDGTNIAHSQDIVDRENSAVIKHKFKGGHCDYIADHSYQGFNIIKSCSLSTSAVIQTKDWSKIYACVGVLNGTNTGKTLITCYGQKLQNIKWADLCCYCCNGSTGKSIAMVFFKESAKFNREIYKMD